MTVIDTTGPFAPLTGLVGRLLQWQRVTWWGRTWRLVDAEGLEDVRRYAVLELSGFWCTAGRLRTAAGVFRIVPIGWLNGPARVERERDGQVVATYARGWLGRGTLRWEDGRMVRWLRHGFTGHAWVQDGDAVADFGWGWRSAPVALERDVAAEEAAVLLGLGCYVRLVQRKRG